MKNIMARWILVLLIAATASQSWAGGVAPAILKAKISGAVRTQVVIGISDGRIGSTPLNNKRVFDEFAVSPDDYELVFSVSPDTELALVPKSSMAKLPTIVVFTLGASSPAFDTKTNTIEVGGPVSNGVATNLFENLAGEVQGTAKFKGTVSTAVITKVSLTGLARGTGASGVAYLSFKVSTGGAFVPSP